MTSRYERLANCAFVGIAMFPLERIDKCHSPIRRMLYLLIFPAWLFGTAIVWIPLTVGATVAEIIDDTWHGRS